MDPRNRERQAPRRIACHAGTQPADYQMHHRRKCRSFSLLCACTNALLTTRQKMIKKQFTWTASIHISARSNHLCSTPNTIGAKVRGFGFWGLFAVIQPVIWLWASVYGLGRPAAWQFVTLGCCCLSSHGACKLRYWRSGKGPIFPFWLFSPWSLSITVSLELLRQYLLPYTVRLYLIHPLMTIITAHLFCVCSFQFLRTTPVNTI